MVMVLVMIAWHSKYGVVFVGVEGSGWWTSGVDADDDGVVVFVVINSAWVLLVSISPSLIDEWW